MLFGKGSLTIRGPVGISSKELGRTDGTRACSYPGHYRRVVIRYSFRGPAAINDKAKLSDDDNDDDGDVVRGRTDLRPRGRGSSVPFTPSSGLA